VYILEISLCLFPDHIFEYKEIVEGGESTRTPAEIERHCKGCHPSDRLRGVSMSGTDVRHHSLTDPVRDVVEDILNARSKPVAASAATALVSE